MTIMANIIACQQAIFAIVSPGIPSIDTSVKPEYLGVGDTISENGARQQYSLGIEFITRYLDAFNQIDDKNKLRLKLITQSTPLVASSSQCFARGVLSTTPGQELTSLDPGTWDPPFEPSNAARNLGEKALPNSYALHSSLSFQMTKLYLLEDFKKYCKEVYDQLGEKQKKYEELTYSTMNKIAGMVGLGNVASYKEFRTLFNYISAYNCTFGSPPISYAMASSNYSDYLSRAAILSYLGGLDEYSMHIARLRTKEIYSAVKLMIEGLVGTPRKEQQTTAQVIHSSTKTFVMMMNMLNLTSKKCNHDRLNEGQADVGTTCEGMPVPSSVIVFEIHRDMTMATDRGQWHVKAHYNGRYFSVCANELPGSKCMIDDFDRMIKYSMWSANEDYYCDLSLNDLDNQKADSYMLLWLFLATFLLLASISMFFIGRTVIKMAQVEIQYTKHQNVIHYAERDLLSSEDVNTQIVNSSLF